MTLNPESVAEWLRDHPEFFESQSTLLGDLRIPHPHGTHAVSLSERQVMALRDKNRALESQLAELVNLAEANDRISGRVHHLAVKLAGARSLATVLRLVQQSLREDFAVPQVAIRLWGVPADPDRAEFGSVLEELRTFVSQMAGPHCGHHALYDSEQWFGNERSELRSFALVPLRSGPTFGALLLGSPDEKRFYPDMGTVFLSRIAELLSAAIRAHTYAPDVID